MREGMKVDNEVSAFEIAFLLIGFALMRHPVVQIIYCNNVY